jgi:hypothetical protein
MEGTFQARYQYLNIYPRLYVSYNPKTQQTTIMTTDLNRLHLSMIEHLNQLSGTSIQPEEVTQLLMKCFFVIQECFTGTAETFDRMSNTAVCCGIPLFTLV